MLKWLRRSTRSWFIYLAIGAIVVVFIFWGVGSYKASRSQDAAEVNGVVIPMTEFSRQYNDLVKQYQERTGGEVTPEMIKSLRLKEMALSQLVEEALLLQAAPRLGLEVTDCRIAAPYPELPLLPARRQVRREAVLLAAVPAPPEPPGFRGPGTPATPPAEGRRRSDLLRQGLGRGTPGILPDGQRGGRTSTT